MKLSENRPDRDEESLIMGVRRGEANTGVVGIKKPWKKAGFYLSSQHLPHR